ncbi:hypothetical protein K438DRAFT_1766014 [Mycena galopus ATCC 62051]|nr:hypothetical protein K438DRAFT_1766014 [Mycena galopus ATCC 62051]
MPENKETKVSGLCGENGFQIAQAADADLTLEHLVLSADSVSTIFSKFSPSWHAVDPSRLDFELGNTHFYGTKIPYRNGTCVQGLYSNDLLFQPTWEEDIADFSIPPNIYTATSDFLLLVSKWIEKEHFPAGRKHVWYGISVHTVMEFFFMAGKGSRLHVPSELLDDFYVRHRFLLAAVCQLFLHQIFQDVLSKFNSNESTTCRGSVDYLLYMMSLSQHSSNFGSLIFGEPA